MSMQEQERLMLYTAGKLARISAGGNATIEALRVSTKTGEGIDVWYQWLEQR